MIDEELDKLSPEELRRLIQELDSEEEVEVPAITEKASKKSKLDKMIHYLNPENNPLLTIPKSLQRGVLSGLTLGGYKHVPASVEYVKNLGKKPYSEAFKEQEQLEQEAERKHPAVFGGSKLASSLALPFASGSLLKSMVSGAAYGAGEKLLNTNPEDITRIKVQDEAITGAGAGAIGKGISKVAEKAVGSDTGKALLRKLGLLRKQANPNYNEEIAKNLEVAKKHGINLTEGEATKNPDLLYSEEMAREGKKGAYNRELLVANKDKNKQRLIELARNLEAKSGKVSDEPGAEIQELLGKISEKAKRKKAEVRKNYTEAENVIGNVDTEELKQLPKELKALLRSKFYSKKTAPAAFDKLSMLNDTLKGKDVEFAELHAWDKALNKSIRNTQGEDREALRIIKENAEEFLDNRFGKGFDARDAYKKARKSSSEYNAAYGEGKKHDDAQRAISELVENKLYSTSPFTEAEVLNRVLGSSPTSFRTDSVHLVRKFKKLHPESEQYLRGEVAKRILNKISDEKIQPGNYEKVLTELKVKNKGLMKELFPDGITDLEELGRLANVTNPGPGNPPQTAKALTQRGREFFEGLPYVGPPIKYGLKGLENLSTHYNIDPDVLLKKYGKEIELPSEDIQELIHKVAQLPSANRPRSQEYYESDDEGDEDDIDRQLDNLSEEQLVELLNSLD